MVVFWKEVFVIVVVVCRSPTLEFWFLFFLSFFFLRKGKNRESGRSVICHRSNMFPQVASGPYIKK